MRAAKRASSPSSGGRRSAAQAAAAVQPLRLHTLARRRGAGLGLLGIGRPCVFYLWALGFHLRACPRL
jgi:hypothetical protein